MGRAGVHRRVDRVVVALGLDSIGTRVRLAKLDCEGAEWPRRLRWPFRAMTLGHVVLSVDELDDDTMRHELVHVRQFEALGVFFLPAYLLASLWAAVRGRHFYRDNFFEADARRRSRSL